MTTYLIKGAAILGGEPTDLLLARRRDRRDRRRARRPTAPRSIDADRAGRAARPGRPAHPPARARPRGRRDGRDRHPGRRAGRLHRRARDGQHRPGRRHRRRRRAGLAARPRGRLLRRAPGRRGHRRAGAASGSPSSARWPTPRPGSGSSPTTASASRDAGADAPGAGVRQGVRRRHRPARPGAAAHRGRPDERGRRCPAGSACAGWPAVAEEAIIARDVLLAEHVGSRLHVCHVSTAGSVEIIRWAKAQGLGRHRRGDARTTCCSPTSWPRPTTRSTRSTRRCAPPTTSRRCATALADGTIDIVATDHAPHPHRGQGVRVGRRRVRHARPRDRAVGRPGDDGRHRPARLGRRRRADVGHARRGSAGSHGHGRPLAAGEPANIVLVRPGGAPGGRLRPTSASLSRNTPYAGMRAARPRWSRRSCAARADRPRREARRVSRLTRRAARPRGRPDLPRRGVRRRGETFGEAVFSTGMTGYQETLTDPSYHRQVVVMTAPHIGNTGINDEDPESRRIWVAGYVVRDPARVPSQLALACAASTTSSREQGVVGIRGIDTRALTRHLRERGAMRVGISSTETDADALLARVRDARADGRRRARRRGHHDRGLRRPGGGGEAVHRRRASTSASRRTTPRMMAERGIEVHVLPATSTLDDVLAVGPDGAVLLQRPRRPGGHRPAQVELLQGALGAGPPVLRHLLRQPALRPRPRLRHLQAEATATAASTSR